jgi:DUF4097 and DUF4098 domain-containing protein YvlB
MRQVVFVGLIGQMLVVSGCYRTALCFRGALTDYKKSAEMQVAFEPGSKLVVRNEAGAVRISSHDGTDCRIAAKVYVHAPHKLEAEEIGEQVQIAAEPNNGALLVTIKKPPMSQNHRFVSVDLDILVPRKAHVDCETDFGQIALTGIEGDVKASTQFGSVTCEDMHGSLDLKTDFGRVAAHEIVSDHLVASSQKGSLDISCADSCPAEIVADVSSEWGKIRFKAPPQYQGAVELESDFGSVKLDIPANVRGTVWNTTLHDKVSGTIGSGKGSLRLFTNLGSVRLR